MGANQPERPIAGAPNPDPILHRLTPRQKLARGGVALAVVLAALAVITRGGAALGPFGATPTPAMTVITGSAPVTLPHSQWQVISLPVRAYHISWYAPAPDDPSAVVLCSGPQPGLAGGGAPGAITVWRTQDSGGLWRGQTLPTTGTYCYGARAPDAPDRLALLVESGADCQGMTLYTSADGGATWTRAKGLPALPGDLATLASNAGALECLIAPSAHHLYFSATPTDFSSGTGSHLWRSDDDGASWQPADRDLGASGHYWPVVLGDTTLAVNLVRPFTFTAGADLWLTRDGGQTWRSLGSNQGDTHLLGVALPTQSGVSTPFALYALAGEQVPAGLLRLRAFSSGDGAGWAPVPPLPVAGATPTQTGLTFALAVTPTGKLLALGVEPGYAIAPDAAYGHPTDPIQAARAAQVKQALWLWDPATARWSALPDLFPLPFSDCALCWHGAVSARNGTLTAWVFGGRDEQQGLYRVALPRA